MQGHSLEEGGDNNTNNSNHYATVGMKMNDDGSDTMPGLETVAEVPQRTMVLVQTKGTSESTQTHGHGQSC